jgi:hypothetical protein
VAQQHRSKPLKLCRKPWKSSHKPWKLQGVALIGAVAAVVAAAAPGPASAQGLFDFLFGGYQRRAAPPAEMSSYTEPPAPVGRVAPPPMGSEAVRQESGSGVRGVAYCVRLCDGQHFPLEHVANATPVEACNAMCPASKTKVFFGSAIDGAVAHDGQHYADLDTAYIYRKQMVANCTCNGKSPFGLAQYDVSKDPTLRPGDLVATTDGFVAYSGKRGDGNSFTPVDTAKVVAELNPSPARNTHLARRSTPAADEDPGTVSPSEAPRPTVDLNNQSVR